MLSLYKNTHKTSLSSTDPLSLSSDSIRKPYKYQESSTDLPSTLDQFHSLLLHSTQLKHESLTQELTESLSNSHKQYIESLTTDLYSQFEEDKKEIQQIFKDKFDNDLKVGIEKGKLEFEGKRKQLTEQFEMFKKEMQEQCSELSRKYQVMSDEESHKLQTEIAVQREKYEREYEERVQKKIVGLEGMFEERKKQLEDEFKLKKERLEFEIRDKVQTQDSMNKAELQEIADKIETQSNEKIKRIENESEERVKEAEERVKAKEQEIKRLKDEHDKKIKEQRKVIEREVKFQTETCEKEYKIKFDREVKKYKEAGDEFELKLKEIEEKLEQEKKKHKELVKANLEKHKAEIRNLKNNHENELIRKKIESNKEMKRAQRELEIENENLKKEQEVQILEKLTQQKKELNNSHTQKLKLEKSKYEQELLDKENELNNKFRDREIEIHKNHEEEMDKLKGILTSKHEKLMANIIENTKAEFKEQYRTELENEVQSATERVKTQYKTETQNLKQKLDELSECQSNLNNSEYNLPLIQRHNQTSQTDPESPSSFKRPKATLQKPFPYITSTPSSNLVECSIQVELNSARDEKELIQAMYNKNISDLNKLQRGYENKITELLEKHMDEIQETKRVVAVVSMKKLERILVLEFEALLTKNHQTNHSVDLIISELISDLTQDQSAADSLNNIKRKLNEVLLKYKQKVDLKAKETKNKFQKDFIQEKKKLQDEFLLMRDELMKTTGESPSILDTGDENGITPGKLNRQSAPKPQFMDFTKEYRLCDKASYDKNIITKVCPAQDGQTIIVDLDRIVSDLNMIKSSLSAAAKQLGFTLIEPHKLDPENQQEQLDPNIPEPVFNASQKYRHLLNTLLRFSRDLILHSNGEDSVDYYKKAEDDIYKHKQEVMSYKLKVSDLKDIVKKSQKDLKLLQEIFQNHLDSQLQIVDFDIFDKSKMTEQTKLVIYKIKKMHQQLLDMQVIFLTHQDDMTQINQK
jgi:hypothetical protein